MASSSVADSTLTRPRVAVAIASTIAAVSLGYYYYRQHQLTDPSFRSGEAGGLHRSNAVRRPRRPSQRQDESSGTESPSDENDNAAHSHNLTVEPPPLDELQPLLPASNPVPVVPTPVFEPSQAPPTEEWYNDPAQAPRQRTGENIVTLLFRVSEDNARRNAYVHRGCLCNGCGMLPIRGIRYRCANCADFDLCEACESQGMHNKTHVFYKVKIPVPSSVARHVQPPWYPGDPDAVLRSLPRYLLAKWSHETGFERVELDALWEQWTFMANTEWREDPNSLGLAMDRKTFERCLVPSAGYRHPAPNLIHDRMFAFYDTNHDDLIGFEEFLHGVSYKKQKNKLRRIFDGYDIDGDGYVSRRDFLRMFRAYYVCYKQMHQDTVVGLDDYMMTTVEAQQLVNSRQPLSSLFGREGRIPDAEHGRPMEGKVYHPDDVRVYDGKGAVSEDKPDTSSRENILRELFTRSNHHSLFTESFGPSTHRPHSPARDSQYLSGILDPPQTLVDLTSLLSGQHPHIDDILDSIRNRDRNHDQGLHVDEDTETGSSDEDDQSTPDDRVEDEGELDQPLGEGNGNIGPSHSILDPRRFLNTSMVEVRPRPQPDSFNYSNRLDFEKRKRIIARKLIYERWKRRQFYLDEEEGGEPPYGWREEQDVLATLNSPSESTKSAPPPLSPRSRSSSKVRFAEDTDEFETRSNHSASSRSVPERWGGMEIPDAERDAGKEILYQVSQQAYNELLDALFKKKEDLAVRVAETKEQREKHRHLLDSLELPLEEEDENTTKISTGVAEFDNSPDDRPIQQLSFEELLARSGYTVHNPEGPDEPRPSEVMRHPEEGEAGNVDLVEGTNVPDVDATERRDPTMPQFRPNRSEDEWETASSTTHSQPVESMSQASTVSGPLESPGLAAGILPEPETRTTRPDTPSPISRSTLATWKLYDLAEQEAKERGGWGRLSYDEFEEIYREHEFQDGSKNRLAYLGSWIDFCIPS
ncbi:hypothetical protein GGS20DRAFT_529189 [Poronia punctata]|nr:hypothetical protein GGS20DRAFT_529189 [Poronia punctata]